MFENFLPIRRFFCFSYRDATVFPQSPNPTRKFISVNNIFEEQSSHFEECLKSPVYKNIDILRNIPVQLIRNLNQLDAVVQYVWFASDQQCLEDLLEVLCNFSSNILYRKLLENKVSIVQRIRSHLLAVLYLLKSKTRSEKQSFNYNLKSINNHFVREIVVSHPISTFSNDLPWEDSKNHIQSGMWSSWRGS